MELYIKTIALIHQNQSPTLANKYTRCYGDSMGEIMNYIIGSIFMIITGFFAYYSSVLVEEKKQYEKKHGKRNYFLGHFEEDKNDK